MSSTKWPCGFVLFTEVTNPTNQQQKVLVDIEIQDPSLPDNQKKVAQQVYDNQPFLANETIPYLGPSFNANALQKGKTYELHVGIFTPQWQQQLDWNKVATFVVV